MTNLEEVVRIADTDFQRAVAQKCVELTTKLMYAILDCQDDAIISASADEITATLKRLTVVFQNTTGQGFAIDDNGSIIEYLSGIQDRFSTLAFIASEIEAQMALI